MSTFFITYMALWGIACIIAISLMFKLRKSLDLFQKAYWDGLFQKWKVTTFVIAATGMTVVAPYTGDPTWDYFDAIFMSVLAYCTAPWAVGTLYLALWGRRDLVTIYIALCIWMFSVSWSYDLYIVIRDGAYPNTWLVNIGASSILYFAAGLFWSLEHIKKRGVVFGFMDNNWPSIEVTTGIESIFWYALPFMVLVTIIIGSFVLQ